MTTFGRFGKLRWTSNKLAQEKRFMRTQAYKKHRLVYRNKVFNTKLVMIVVLSDGHWEMLNSLKVKERSLLCDPISVQEGRPSPSCWGWRNVGGCNVIAHSGIATQLYVAMVWTLLDRYDDDRIEFSIFLLVAFDPK